MLTEELAARMSDTNGARPPAQALDAERSVLAAMLLTADACRRAGELLQPTSFYRVGHRKMFEALLRISERGERPDSIGLTHELEANQDLEAAGGQVAIAGILEHATTTANLDQHARIIQQAHGRRQARKIGLRIAEIIEDPSRDLDLDASEAIKELRKVQEVYSPTAGADRLIAQSLSHDQLLAKDLKPIEPVIGTGLIVRGELTILASMPGLGKTYLALQMMRSVALGTPWLDYETQQGPAGLIELEMSEIAIRDRVRSNLPAGTPTHYLIMPESFRYLTEPGTADAVSRWAIARNLTVIVMDPLYLRHDGSENEAEDVGRFLDACRLVARRTNAALVILHHVNKMEMDEKSGLRTSVLRSVRGSGRLVSDPATVLGIIERHGARELVFAKTRLCASPVSIGIKAGDDGYFTVVNTSEQIGDKNTEKIEKCLAWYGAEGCTMTDLTAKTGLAKNTIKRRLRSMGVVELEGLRGVPARYFLRGNAPAEAQIPLEPERDW